METLAVAAVPAALIATLLVAYLVTAADYRRGMRANDLTRDQRCAIVNRMMADQDWLRLSKHFEAVPYEAHLDALLEGRDPTDLYHPDLIALVRAEAS